MAEEQTMSETQMQTVSGTVPAVTREGQNIVLNWEAKGTVQEAKETVHVRAWATNEDNQAVPVYQFHGAVISPQFGDAGRFHSPTHVADYEADILTFDVPEPTDIGLQVGMYLSEEKNRDQSITDVGDINFPAPVSR
jgi:hypothetical protein